MFIKKSFVDEIANSMERQLVDGIINKRAAQEEQLVKAANYLNAAAEIFDESGLGVHAELITAVLESLAAKKSKKKKKDKPKAKSAPKAKKAPSSEKMVTNLKEKGWVFDESDANDANFIDDNCALCGSMSKDKLYDDSDAKDTDEPVDESELLSMLDDFKTRSGDEDFEDEDLNDPDTFSEEAYHPDFKKQNEEYRRMLDDEDAELDDLGALTHQLRQDRRKSMGLPLAPRPSGPRGWDTE
jgi:hypothetical protein